MKLTACACKTWVCELVGLWPKRGNGTLWELILSPFISPITVVKWDLQAIEINLRKGGTTHPFMTLKYLTNGRYDLSTGLFYSQQGQEKYYIASDNLQKDRYQGLMPTT
jgi:hypothetical protein